MAPRRVRPETPPPPPPPGPPEPPGPVKSRSCTDVLCLLLWLAFAAGWAAVAVVAYRQGDPALLLHPTDSQGAPCGAAGTPNEHKPYLQYYDITACASALSAAAGCPTPQFCVAECPPETYVFLPTSTCDEAARGSLVCKPGVRPTGNECEALIEAGQCKRYVIKSAPVLSRCIPNVLDSDILNGFITDATGQNTSVSAELLQRAADAAGELVRLRGLGVSAFSDLQHSWWVIVAACAAAALLSLLWIFLMRYLVAPLVWAAFLGALGVDVYGCVYTYIRYHRLQTGSATPGSFNPLDAFRDGFASVLDQPEFWLGLFVVLCALGVLLLLVMVVLRSRVRVATAVIGQASRAVTSSLGTLFFPVVPGALQLAVVALFISVALYVASMGEASYAVTDNLPPACTASGCPYNRGQSCEPVTFGTACPASDCKDGCVFSGYTQHRATPYLHAYNVFGLFWGLFFCSALGELILAGAFASWYWTFDKKRDLPWMPVLGSSYRAVRFHLGTVAFGSLIIAIIRFARVTLDYIQRKTKSLENPVSRCLVCCCKCCLWCLEKFMRYINRNAYIVCAVRGSNFCKSAWEAFSLLMRNILRVVVIDSTCDIFLFLGKLVVTALVTIAAFFFMDERIPIEGVDRLVPTTQHSWVPLSTIAVGAFFIANVFFSVYTMAVDTIFLCFLEDLESNDGTPEKPYFMSRSLMKLLGKKNKRYDSEKYQ